MAQYRYCCSGGYAGQDEVCAQAFERFDSPRSVFVSRLAFFFKLNGGPRNL